MNLLDGKFLKVAAVFLLSGHVAFGVEPLEDKVDNKESYNVEKVKGGEERYKRPEWVQDIIDHFSKHAKVDGSNITGYESGWYESLGKGSVKKGDDALIKGDTLYDEVRGDVTGGFVSADKTVGKNLSILDEKIVENRNAIDNKVSNSDFEEYQGQLKEKLTNQTISYKVNNNEKKEVKLSEGLRFVDGRNMHLETTGDGSIKFSTNKNLRDIHSITGNGRTIKLEKSGISVENSKITNVLAGEDPTDAVNRGQLDNEIKKIVSENTQKLKDYAAKDASNISAEKWHEKLGMITADGKYIKSSNSVRENLEILDKNLENVSAQVEKNTEQIKNLSNGGSLSKELNLSYGANSEEKYQVSLDKGLTFENGNFTTAVAEADGKVKIDVDEKKLKDALKDSIVIGKNEMSFSSGDDNIKVDTTDPKKVEVSLNKNLKEIESITSKDSKTKITLGEKGKNKVNFNGAKVTGIKKGKVSKNSTEAVNGSQLYETERKIGNVAEGVRENSHRIGELKNRVEHVGSLSAALAGLHPMQYDPEAPSQILAAIGTYRDSQAVAIGASHYVNENFLVSAGFSMGTENHDNEYMGNLGFAWKFGRRK